MKKEKIATYEDIRFLIEYAKHVAPHLKIIASAGSPEKIDILKKVGADVAINYKTEDVAKVLREHGPIDMYVVCGGLSSL